MTEEHFIEVEDGEEIAVTHAEADSDRWLFVCHGFGGNRERQSEYLQLSEEGFNVVTLNFRGNGEADGEFIEQDLSSRIADLEAAVEYFKPGKTFLFGTSFGAKVVFHALEDLDIEAAVTKAPVTYSRIMDKFREVVDEKGRFEFIEGKPIDERFFEDFDTYSFEEAVEKIDIPVAIFHGAADTTVHIENSFRAVEELNTDVMLQKLKGEKHSFSDSGKEKLFDSMVDWMKNT